MRFQKEQRASRRMAGALPYIRSTSGPCLKTTLQTNNSLIGDVDPHVLSVYLQAGLDGLALNWLIDPERVHPADWAPQVAKILLYGIHHREGSAPW